MVFAIGPNLARRGEMNRESKLGEDIARANETLLTESALQATSHRDDVRFEIQDLDDQLFPFYRVIEPWPAPTAVFPAASDRHPTATFFR